MYSNMNYFKDLKTKTNIVTFKTILLRKLIIIAIISFLIFLSFLIIKHYFYILNSYYYTAEFHFNFIRHHLKDSDSKFFAEYFMSLNTIHKILPFLFFAYLVQTFYFLYPTPILILSSISAIGLFKAILTNYLAIFITGILLLAISYFLFGDLSKIFLRDYHSGVSKKNIKFLSFILINIMFAIPLISMLFPLIASPILNINFKKIVFSFSFCLTLRIFLQIAYMQF